MNTELKLHPTVKSYIENEQYLLIDGQDVAAADKATMETLDPATGKVLTMTAHAGKADVDQAVDSAERAMKAGWATMLPGQRAAILNRLADIGKHPVDRFLFLQLHCRPLRALGLRTKRAGVFRNFRDIGKRPEYF